MEDIKKIKSSLLTLREEGSSLLIIILLGLYLLYDYFK